MNFFSLPNRGNSFNSIFYNKKQTDKEIFIMDAVYVGWLSILPPMIAIILALITKEVLFSLIAGVLSGTLIYSIASGMNPIVGPVSTVFDVMIQKTDMNIIIFCFLLGGLVYLINASGGAQAYGKWASKIIRTKRSSLLLTSITNIK